MSLPVWDTDTVLNYKGRWKALKRVGHRIEQEPAFNRHAKVFIANNAFVEEADLTPPFQMVDVMDAAGNPKKTYLWTGSEYRSLQYAKTLDPADHGGEPSKPLNYDTLYEGLRHLLDTQPGNTLLERLIRHLDGTNNRRSYYHEVEIPKKREGTRTLTVPSHPLKWVQRSLLTVLTHLFPRHKCAHGFERDKSIITHARQHVGKRYVYTIDIKDFFPSITRNRVFGMLKAYPFHAPQAVARYLANLTCYEGCLPQGAPTSPILSNLLCRRLDSRLFKWARRNGYTYSRYADDLTFSTDNEHFPSKDQRFIDSVIEDEGFAVNEEKRRLQPYHERQMVTGLIVNEKLNLPREKIRGLRALLHNVKEHGWASQVGRTSIFDSMDEWREYVAGAGAKHIEARQQKNRRLLNPAAVLANARTVAELQEVMQGKVAFVGAVRGDDDPVYQRMLRTLHELTGRYAKYAAEKAKGADYFRKHRYMDPADDEAARRESQVQHYHQFMRWKARFEKGKLSQSEFREHLATWKDDALEIGWLLQRTNGMEPDTSEEVRRIASQLDTDPRETSRFFQSFDDDIAFRGLLHSPDEGSAPPQRIMGACCEAADATLPNQLENHTNRILNKCGAWLEKNPNRYPWPPYGDETNLKKDLQDYKKAVRFRPSKPGQGLWDQLCPHVERLESEFDVSIVHQGRDRYFRTYTPVVLSAIKTILSSMAEHTKSDTVRLSVDQIDVADSNDVVVRIWDDDSSIDDAPNLTSLFRGDTRRALYQQNSGAGLRGYAHWTIIAPFSDGSSDGSVYEFDVMRNTRSEAPNHQLGVMHRLTFPQ
jgi:hypothetical protein